MLKPKEIEITEEAPFQNCALKREPYANILTDIVVNYASDGCVMALNATWGAGKTTFVKMWRQKLNNQHLKTLYFNAWESDFTADPIIAILSELKELNGDNEKYKEVASKVGRVFLTTLISIAKQLLKNKLFVDPEVIKDAADEIAQIGKEALKEYQEQKETLEDFRKLLRDYIASNAEEGPVVFFIDELDRCNPSFAVLLLERIKHIFSVPNIVFVLSVNSQQLQYAIQGYYGSSAFDAKEYLRRFIDIEYNLPKPDVETFCQYLYHQYDLDSFFSNHKRREHYQLSSEGADFMEIVKTVVSPDQVTLRDLEQMFIYIRLALSGFAPSQMSLPSVFFLLVYWKYTNNDFYQDILNRALNCQELFEKIEQYTPRNRMIEGRTTEPRSYVGVVAQLIISYNCNENGYQIENILKQKENSKDKESVFHPKAFSKELLDEALILYSNDLHRSMIPLSYLIQRIELLNHLTMYE